MHRAIELFNKVSEKAALAAMMFLPTAVLIAFIGLAYSSSVEARPESPSKVRTIPVVVFDKEGNFGFTWVSTVDERDILICFAANPIPREIECHIRTGNRYTNGVEETKSGTVNTIAPPKAT